MNELFQIVQNFISEQYINTFGFIAMSLAFIGFAQKNDDKTLYIIIASCTFWIIHFLVLGAYSGVAASSVSLLRLVLSLKYKGDKRLFGGIIVLTIFLGIFTFTGITSILPIIASCIGAYAYFFEKHIRMRVFLLMGTVLWLSFHISLGSTPGILTEIVGGSILLSTIFRLYKEQRQIG